MLTDGIATLDCSGGRRCSTQHSLNKPMLTKATNSARRRFAWPCKTLLSALLASTLLVSAFPLSAANGSLYSFADLSGSGFSYDPLLANVVVTHGIQVGSSYFLHNQDSAFQEVPGWIADMLTKMNGYQQSGPLPRFNALAYTYPGAFFVGDLGGLSFNNAARIADWSAATAGFGLAANLASRSQWSPVQLIGHSIGTHVNAFAALGLNAMGLSVDQVTILDRPFAKTPVDDAQLFKYALSGNVSWVDNYYGGGTAAYVFIDLPPCVLGFSGGNLDLCDSPVNHIGTGRTLPGASTNTQYDDTSHEGVHVNYVTTLNALSGGFASSVVNNSRPFPPDRSGGSPWDASQIDSSSKQLKWIGGVGSWSEASNWKDSSNILYPDNGHLFIDPTGNVAIRDRFAAIVSADGKAVISGPTTVTVDHLSIEASNDRSERGMVFVANGSGLVLDSSLGIDPISGLRVPGVSLVKNAGVI